MPYGSIKVDNIVFTNSGVDQTVTVSGLVQSVSGNLTVTGTISGNLIRGTTVSGATITGSVLSVASGLFASGTVGAPTIGFAGDGNTGFWSPAGDTVALSTGGSERIRVDSDGDLGVGTTAPTSRLTVRADATSGPNTIIRVENRAASAGAITQNIKIEGIFDYNNGTSDASAGAILFGKEGTYTTATTANDSYLAFETVTDNSSTEKLRIDSSGRLLVGTSSARLSDGGAIAPAIQHEGSDPSFMATRATADTAPSHIVLGKSRGSAYQVVSSGDSIGLISFQAADGTNLIRGAEIRAVVDGTPGTNDMPGRLVFSTTADGAASPTERMRINSAGRLLLGATTSRTITNGLETLRFQVEGTGVDRGISVINNVNAVGETGKICLGKSRGTAVGSVTALQNDDLVGNLEFQGADGTNMVPLAQIIGAVDGIPGTGDMPGRLVFGTTADGAASSTERMRINSTGQILAASLGTAALPVWSFTGDLNTGIYSPSADTVAISTGGVQRFAISSSGVSITGTLTVSSTTLVSNLNADLLDGLNSSDFFRGNDFANTGSIRINNASPTIGLIDTDHATASIHVNSNIFYILRNAANTPSWVQVDGIWPLEINLLNNDAQFGRTVTSQSYQNIVKFSAPWRNNGVTALASSFNYVMTAGNDTGNKLSMFINSSTRTDDGGANALTFRNDGGVLNLGQTGTQTNIFGSQINLSGGSTYYLKNNPAISNGSYAAGNNHIELRTSDGSNPILGFHRAGFTAVALYHDTSNSLRIRDAGGADSLLWHSGNDGAGSGLDADILSGTIRISAFDFSATTPTQRISAQSGNLYICNGNGGSADNPLSIQRANSTGNAIRFINVSSQVGTVVINAASTSYNTTSDYRLKENVVPLTGALNRLKLIPVHRFNFTADPDKTVDGFLAHEVQDFVPEAITGVKDEMEAIGAITDADGNVIQENVTQPSTLEEGQEWEQTGVQPVYQGIDQAKLVPLLTAALQEAIAKIEILETKVAALEAV